MKKMIPVLLFVGLISGSLFGQWTAGTKSVGSLFSYSSDKNGMGYTLENLDDEDKGTTTMSIEPSVEYFVMDNLSVEVMLQMDMVNNGNSDGDLAKAGSTMHFGGGAKYYMGNIYAGGGLKMMSTNTGGPDPLKGNTMIIKAGYLYPLADGIYLDCGFNYTMGMGKWKTGDTEIDNKWTNMGLGVGIATYF